MKIFSRNEKRATIYTIWSKRRSSHPKKKRTFASRRRNLGRKWRETLIHVVPSISIGGCTSEHIGSSSSRARSSLSTKVRKISARAHTYTYTTTPIYVILSAALDEGRRAHIHTQRDTYRFRSQSPSLTRSLVALALSRDAKDRRRRRTPSFSSPSARCVIYVRLTSTATLMRGCPARIWSRRSPSVPLLSLSLSPARPLSRESPPSDFRTFADLTHFGTHSLDPRPIR